MANILGLVDIDAAVMESARMFTETFLILVLLLVAGYVLGFMLVSNVVRRILLFESVQAQLVRLGATTAERWKSLAEFSAQYAGWVVLFFVLTIAGGRIPQTETFFNAFVIPVTVLVLSVIVAILVSSVVGKVVKDALVTLGPEEELAKYKIGDSLGGMSLSSILASIVKWFAFLLLIENQVAFLLPKSTLLKYISGLLSYVPNAVLGILVLVASVVLAGFAASRIKSKQSSVGDVFAVGVEVVIIFFGIVLALPRLFGIDDPQVFQTSLGVMTQSFLILMVGVALGVAIAMGLGLKDSVSKMAEKAGR